MRAVLLVLFVLGCGPSNEEICRKDAKRWGECVGELAQDNEFAAAVQQTLESKIDECVRDEAEAAIARACLDAPSCDAWTECWQRRGKPAGTDPPR